MPRFAAISLSALLCLVVAEPANAQRGGDKMVGIQFGATTSDMYGGGVNTNSRWGGTAGLVTGWRASRNTVVTLEGNKIFIDVTITPVQGVDFILPTIVLDDTRQVAA